MISSVEMKSGFASELKNLKGRKFEFQNTCNILFGPNGCGKTTILKVLAGHTGIDTSNKQFCGGWSKPPVDRFNDNSEYPRDFANITIGKVNANVDWDGVPCFYNSASLGETGASLGFFVSDPSDSPDGMMSFDEQLALTMGHYSEGELRLMKIKKVVDNLKKPPLLPKEFKKEDKSSFKAFVKYLNTLSKKGNLTLLWDEPDRSLNIRNQIDFWTHFVPNITGAGFQLIISSHSMIPLFMPKFNFINFIDVEPGYSANGYNSILNLMDAKLKIDGARAEAEKKEETPENEVESIQKPQRRRKKG